MSAKKRFSEPELKVLGTVHDLTRTKTSSSGKTNESPKVTDTGTVQGEKKT